MAQPISSEIPRGMIRNRLSIRSGGRLPWGFSQVAAAGTRRMAARAIATASSPRSWACEPPAWKAIGNAWPVVCMTAFAISCERAFSRSRISTHTAARVSSPASRQAGSAACIAGSRASTSATG